MVEKVAHGCSAEGGNRQSWPLVMEFLDYLRKAGIAPGYLQEFPGPVKHLLVWLDRNRIRLDAVDGDIVRQFLTHSCDCPRPPGERYQTRHMHKPVFKGRIFHFVQFLEESGRIENPSSLDEGLRRLGDFIAYLSEQRYSPTTMKAYEFCCRHFVTWLHQHRIPLTAFDEGILRRFATHECICPGTFVHKAERNRDYQFRIERFVRFLITNGVLSSVASVDVTGTDDLRDFRDWLRRKGRRERVLPLWKETQAVLKDWLRIRPESDTGAVFLNGRGEAITRHGFASRLSVHIDTAQRSAPSLARKKVTPHMLRHTCAIHTLRATGDVRRVALWLGHSSVVSTEIYLRIDPAEKLDILDAGAPPLIKKGTFTGVSDRLLAMLANARGT